MTTGATFSAKKLFYEKYDKSVKFEIWDTCGQEKYRSLTHLFYKDALVAILVYDITSKTSYNEVINFWYNEIKEKGAKDVLIVICGNKSDLFDKEEISGEVARNWAKEKGISYYETSAKNKSGITEMFYGIGNTYLNMVFDFSDINKEENDNQVNHDIINAYKEKEDTKKEKKKKKKETVKLDEVIDKDDSNARSRCC